MVDIFEKKITSKSVMGFIKKKSTIDTFNFSTTGYLSLTPANLSLSFNLDPNIEEVSIYGYISIKYKNLIKEEVWMPFYITNNKKKGKKITIINLNNETTENKDEKLKTDVYDFLNNVPSFEGTKIIFINLEKIIIDLFKKYNVDDIKIEDIYYHHSNDHSVYKTQGFKAQLVLDVDVLKIPHASRIKMDLNFFNMSNEEKLISDIIKKLRTLSLFLKNLKKSKHLIFIKNTKIIKDNTKCAFPIGLGECERFNTFSKHVTDDFYNSYYMFEPDEGFLKFKNLIETPIKCPTTKNINILGFIFKISFWIHIDCPIFFHILKCNDGVIPYLWLKHTNKLEEFYSKIDVIKLERL